MTATGNPAVGGWTPVVDHGLLEDSDDAIVAADSRGVLTVWNLGAERMYGWSAAEVLGHSVTDVAQLGLGFECGAPIRLALDAAGRWRGEVVARRRDGTPIDVEQADHVVRDSAGEIAGYVGIHRDVTVRTAAEVERARGAYRQKAIAEFGLRALAESDRPSLMDAATAIVSRTLDAELAGVAELLPSGEILLRSGVGWAPDSLGLTAGGDSLVGYAVANGSPVVCDDVTADPRFAPSRLLADHGVAGAVVAVIGRRDEPGSVLGAYSRRAHRFSAADAGFVQAIADVLATARRRSAVHDPRFGGSRPRPFTELLAELVDAHRAAVTPEVDLELLAGTADAPSGATGSQMIDVLGAVLSNACGHAGVTRVHVRAGVSGSGLWTEVSDDGTAPAAADGTAAMRELAEQMGADLSVRSEPVTGTTVRIALRDQAPAGEVRVLVVDHQTTVREALANAFSSTAGFRLSGTATSLAQARAMLGEVDVAVLAIRLPDGAGADLIEDLRRRNPGARALVVGSSLSHAELARAVERGAAAVLHETASLAEIMSATRRLHAGETLVPLEQVVELLRFDRRERDRGRDDRALLAQLTRREREVLQLLTDGLSGEGIAARLVISPSTQRNHVANILAKLDVHSQLQAVVLALRNDVVVLHPADTGADVPGGNDA